MLLEQAAGIIDNEASKNYINQLSYLQDVNERQTADIAYLKVCLSVCVVVFC